MLINHKYNRRINLFDLLLWVIISSIFPLFSGFLVVLSMIKLLFYIGATFFVGNVIIGRINAIQNFSSFIFTGLCIVFGSTICGLLYLFFPFDFLIYLIFVVFIIYCFINKETFFQINSLFDLLSYAPLFLMLFTTMELTYGTQIRLNRADGDYFYYTAIVESLKTNQSFLNSIYHQGIGINYQALALLPAAHLAHFLQLPSQIVLWGIYFKILPIITFGVAASVIIQIFKHYFNPQIILNRNYLLQFFVACMLMFLGPIHLLNLLKLDFENIIFLGEGYLIPIGSPGFAFSMLFSSLALYFIITIENPKWYERIIFISFLAFITASKLALFFPLTILLGTYALLLILKKEFVWLYTLLFAMPVCILIYKFTLGSSDSISVISFTKQGYYFSNFNILADKYHITGSTTKKTIVMLLISVFMWLNFKSIILLASINHLKKTNLKFIFLIISAFVSFIFAVLPSFFLKVTALDEKGKFLYDGSFDMPQFIRADIYLISIITIIFILYFAFQYKHKLVSYLTLTTVILWMIIIAISFLKTNFKNPILKDESWYYEVAKDFQKIKPKLMVMAGSENFSGQVLCGLGVQPWFCSGFRIDLEGYISTKTVHYRNFKFQQLFDTTFNKTNKNTTINYLKRNGVDCVVANPSTIHKINIAVADSILTKIDGTKWLYKIN
jgi:hypothetical protein